LIKNNKTPKRKRLTKNERLNAATSWLKEYNGKSIISGYAKWFGVDKIGAIHELKMIGVEIPEKLENQIVSSIKLSLEQKRIIKEEKKISEAIQVASNDYFTFIEGYTSWGFPFGITYEEMEEIEEPDETKKRHNKI